MGLDMYLYKKKILKDDKEKIISVLSEEDNYQQVAYWRKEYEKHEWFNVEFGNLENCEFYLLTKEQLKQFNIIFDDEQVKEILEYTNFDDYEIYYYAWW